MRAALTDPDLFGQVLEGDSWRAWRALLIAGMGEPLTEEERAIFRDLTGRPREPEERVDELWAIVGRRGGKTRAAAVLAAYIAALVDWRDVLAPGERAVLPIMSASVWQAQKAMQYVSGVFSCVPALAPLVESETSDTLSLSTRVDIECRPANFRTARGVTAVAAIADEIAFWRSEDSKNPDAEILAALRPALATTGGMLVCISSPYARRGELYQTWKRHYGPDGDAHVLVARSASRTMNPTLPERVVERAYERDSASAAAEYDAQFRSDVENFVSADAVDAVVVPGRRDLPRLSGIRHVGFVDPSGGSSDSMALAIAHREGETAVLDLLREAKPPFDPDAVAREFASILKGYGVYRVRGDRYGGLWPSERFVAHGVQYEPSPAAKSELYSTLLPLINARRVELPDDARLVSQLTGLERRTARGGRDSIDHAPGGHDDLANAAAGALVAAAADSGELVALESYLNAGRGVDVPQRPDLVFASAYVKNDGAAAAVIWARSRFFGWPLTALSFEEGKIGSAFLDDLNRKLGDWCDLTGCGRFGLVSDEATIGGFAESCARRHDRRSYFVQEIGRLADHPQLPALVAAYVNDGQVKIAAPALERAANAPIGAALSFTFSDAATPLQLAAMHGIAAGLAII